MSNKAEPLSVIYKAPPNNINGGSYGGWSDEKGWFKKSAMYVENIKWSASSCFNNMESLLLYSMVLYMIILQC